MMRWILVAAVVSVVAVGIWVTLRDDDGPRHEPARSAVDPPAAQRSERGETTETTESRRDAEKDDPWERLPRADVLPVRVTADGPEGILDELDLEELRDGEWHGSSASFTLGDDFRAFDVPPGRYRLVLKDIRAVVTEFTVAGALTLDLDLTRAERLGVHVDIPGGYSKQWVSVWATDGENEYPLPRRPHKRVPYFEMFLPGDRNYRIEPRHPLLRGAVHERHRGGSVTLRMETGPLLRFTIAGSSSRSVYTVLYRPGDLEVPVLDEFAPMIDGSERTYGLTGWKPGTYDVLFHLPEHVPVERRVTIPAEGLDVGKLPLERGSWVRFTKTERRLIRLESLTTPRIVRLARDWIVKGLPAGRYRVNYMGGGKWTEREITVDGVSDFELDLR